MLSQLTWYRTASPNSGHNYTVTFLCVPYSGFISWEKTSWISCFYGNLQKFYLWKSTLYADTATSWEIQCNLLPHSSLLSTDDCLVCLFPACWFHFTKACIDGNPVSTIVATNKAMKQVVDCTAGERTSKRWVYEHFTPKEKAQIQ